MPQGRHGNLRWGLKTEIGFSGQCMCVKMHSYFELIGKIEECFNEENAVHIFSAPPEAEKDSIIIDEYFLKAGEKDPVHTRYAYREWVKKSDTEEGSVDICIHDTIRALEWSRGARFEVVVSYKKPIPLDHHSESFDIPINIEFPFYEHAGALNLDSDSEVPENISVEMIPPDGYDWEDIENIRNKIFTSLYISKHDKVAYCTMESGKIIFEQIASPRFLGLDKFLVNVTLQVKRQTPVSPVEPRLTLSLHFADRLIEQAKKLDSRLIIGLDPDLARFPTALHSSTNPIMTENQLEDAIFQFNKIVIDATSDCAVAYKPQVAFYEQYGIAGMRALQHTIEFLRSRKLISILDAKRNDVSHTAEAYAKAWLSPLRQIPPSQNPLQVDAMTINGYLGKDGILPFLEVNREAGLFILAKTSNPSSVDLQDLLLLADGQTVYARIAHLAKQWGETEIGKCGYSRVGLVVGATYEEATRQLRDIAPQALFLMPGVGTQAGSLKSIAVGAGMDKFGAYAAASRSILYNYRPEDINGDNWIEKLKKNVSEQANTLKTAIQEELN